MANTIGMDFPILAIEVGVVDISLSFFSNPYSLLSDDEDEDGDDDDIPFLKYVILLRLQLRLRLARDFVGRLLQTDPKARLTPEQALNHPWIRVSIDRITTDSYLSIYPHYVYVFISYTNPLLLLLFIVHIQ